jgi:PHD/YefM family antitoxin component YafN of YafNO toxin-antitoxin module
MKLSSSVKTVGFLEKHASEIIEDIYQQHTSMVITKDGEVKAVLLDIQTYEEFLESLSLLKVLALSNNSLKTGNVRPMKESFRAIRNSILCDTQL